MESSTARMLEIYDRISSPLITSLLTTHPNQVTLDGDTPDLWSSWWDWAAEYDREMPKWQQLLSYYCRPHSLHAASKTRGPSSSSFGMSLGMATFTHSLVNHGARRRSAQHVVDVGSGQGYLSRALKERGLHVLALDNNENQTSGANNWKIKDALRTAHEQRRNSAQNVNPCPSQTTPRSHSKGSLTHRTVHIQPTSLEAAIEDWLPTNTPDTFISSPHPIPIMFVALHACGSLSVDVLRTFLSHHSAAKSERRWEPHSLVVVGCCYNLISPSDFPLSKPLLTLSPRPTLPNSALHLATQMPAHWFRTEKAGRAARLAVRKVVYRALLQPIIHLDAQCRKEPFDSRSDVRQSTSRPYLGGTPENRRLGKLNDASYADWNTFLVSATTKLGDQLPLWILNPNNNSEHDEDVIERLRMESRLEVMHVLRCILGPLIESLILLDRYKWFRGELGAVRGTLEVDEEGREKLQNGVMTVEMVNLFDQVTGSGRNVALVASPA
ncbi:methyltransferase domain-containing protein [Pisolithus marmoratus]|nr:methyltransferase domain-containing protein [Pisolithus marmoratus]